MCYTTSRFARGLSLSYVIIWEPVNTFLNECSDKWLPCSNPISFNVSSDSGESGGSSDDNQGCPRVHSRITWTQIALIRSHTDHSQRVTRFPRVSLDQITVVYELLALNCHCPFISDIALTPAIARCTATDHRPPPIIPSCSLPAGASICLRHCPLALNLTFCEHNSLNIPWLFLSIFMCVYENKIYYVSTVKYTIQKKRPTSTHSKERVTLAIGKNYARHKMCPVLFLHWLHHLLVFIHTAAGIGSGVHVVWAPYWHPFWHSLWCWRWHLFSPIQQVSIVLVFA